MFVFVDILKAEPGGTGVWRIVGNACLTVGDIWQISSGGLDGCYKAYSRRTVAPTLYNDFARMEDRLFNKNKKKSVSSTISMYKFSATKTPTY